MENKIPTAEEFLNLLGVPYRNGLENRRGNYISPDELIKFAKLHVEAALKEASEDANMDSDYYQALQVYPLTNIK